MRFQQKLYMDIQERPLFRERTASFLTLICFHPMTEILLKNIDLLFLYKLLQEQRKYT